MSTQPRKRQSSARAAEVAALAAAIVRTARKIADLRVALACLEAKQARQEAEYGFQKLVLRAESRAAKAGGGL